MTNIARKIDDGIYFVEKILLTTALLIMVVLVFLDVINRHFHLFGNSFVWAKEVARFMMIWVGFIGASIATKHMEHLSVGLRDKLFPPKILRWIKALANLIATIVTLFFAYLGYRFVMESYQFSDTSLALKFPLWVVQIIIPISLVIIAIRFLGQVVINVQEALERIA